MDVYLQGNHLHLVLEFLVTDLELVIKQSSAIFTYSDLKSWMWMICSGLTPVFLLLCFPLNTSLLAVGSLRILP